MNGCWVGGLMDELGIDGQIDGWKNEGMDELIGWKNEGIDGWMNWGISGWMI